MAQKPNYFTLTERTYLNRQGQVCNRDDKRRASLLGGQGAQIPLKRAIELGLANADGMPVVSAEWETVSPAGNHEQPDPANATEQATEEYKAKEEPESTKAIPEPPSTMAVDKPENAKSKTKK